MRQWSELASLCREAWGEIADIDPVLDRESSSGRAEALAELSVSDLPHDDPDGDDLADVLVAVLAAAWCAEACQDEDRRARFAAVLDRLASMREEAWREATDLVSLGLFAFRFGSVEWAAVCGDRSPLRAAPDPLRIEVAEYLRRLALAEALLRFAAAMPQEALKQLAERLRPQAEDARARIANSPVRSHLWPLRHRAETLGLGDLIPRLTESAEASDGGCAMQSIRAAAQEDEGLRRDLLSASVHGWLEPQLVPLVRELATSAGQWIVDYRQRFCANGFLVRSYLEKQGESWTAGPARRIAPAEVRQLAGDAPRSLPAGVPAVALGGDAGATIDAVVPAVAREREITAPVASHALARRTLELAEVEVDLFGAANTLWCRARQGDDVVEAACESTFDPRVLCGAVTQFPIRLVAQPGVTLPDRPFRLGPLRDLARISGRAVDRLYSPRAYLVTVGERCLIELLGWPLQEASARLAEAARAAGYRKADALLKDLIEVGPQLEWVAALPALGRAGRGTLGETLAQWGDADPATAGPELDTLFSLPEAEAPVDGDEFTLLATRTATSVLAAQVLSFFLRTRFPHAHVALTVCDAMVQAGVLDPGRRHELPEHPLQAVYDSARLEVLRWLHDRGADPLLVISGGAKWESAAMLELAMDAQVAVAYKFELGKLPILLRLDRMLPRLGAQRARPVTFDSVDDLDRRRERRWVILSVGISLLGAYLRANREAGRQPDARLLVAWVRDTYGADWWRASAELTGYHAWRHERARDVENDEDVNVVLVQTRKQEQEAYAPGRVCARAVRELLEDRGVNVHMWPKIDVENLASVKDSLDAGSVFSWVVQPLAYAVDAAREMSAHGETPDVLVTAGQKLTAAFLQIVARGRGCAVFLAPEPGDEQGPRLWLVHAGGSSDSQLARDIETSAPRLFQTVRAASA